MTRFIYLIALAAMTALSGCGTSAILERGAQNPAADESIVVIGVSSPDHRVMFFPGEITKGVFQQSLLGNAAINGVARDGYVVAKATAGQLLGLTRVTAPKGDRLFYGQAFAACGGQRTLVFEVPKAQVVYLTDIAYEPNADRLSVSIQNRLSKAQEHLRSNFPDIQTELKQHEFQVLGTTRSCEGSNSTIIIPIYIRR